MRFSSDWVQVGACPDSDSHQTPSLPTTQTPNRAFVFSRCPQKRSNPPPRSAISVLLTIGQENRPVQGAQLFQAVGLDKEVISRCFTGCRLDEPLPSASVEPAVTVRSVRGREGAEASRRSRRRWRDGNRWEEEESIGGGGC